MVNASLKNMNDTDFLALGQERKFDTCTSLLADYNPFGWRLRSFEAYSNWKFGGILRNSRSRNGFYHLIFDMTIDSKFFIRFGRGLP